MYWLHLIDKIFTRIKPCRPIFIPQPWDEHADMGTTKATSPLSRSSVPTQYRDSRSRAATNLYSCLHFPFSGANAPSTLSSACRYLPTISSSSAVRCRGIFVAFLEIIAYASSFPFRPSIHVHHFSSAPRFSVHAPSLSARLNMTLSVGLGIFRVHVTHGGLWVVTFPIFEVFAAFPHLWAKFVTPSRATPPFGPAPREILKSRCNLLGPHDFV